VHEVDFYMRGAVVKAYDGQGRLLNQLTGREMRHYADNATIEVDQPRWQGVTPQGRVTRAWAERGLSQDDGSQVQLLGQAVVVREPLSNGQGRLLPRLEFRGEFLHIFADDERMRSHLPVEFTSGGHRFSADSFNYEHQAQVVELAGRVKARIAAPTERSR
jgi:lipopolysaccharide export system protein LptC